MLLQKTPVTVGTTTPTATLGPNMYQWYAIQNPVINLAVTLIPVGAITQNLNLAWSMNANTQPFPSIFDSNFLANGIPLNTPTPISNPQVIGIHNPSGNQVSYQLQFTSINGAPIPPQAAGVVTPNQAQLALSLGAIIGIALGGFALVLIVVGLVCVYSRVQTKKAEYKPVATSEKEEKKEKEKEPSSTTSSSTTDSAQDEATDEERDDDEYDSYPPPRNSSRVYRSRGGNNRENNRGPNSRGPSRSRDRSYSDEDDDSSDYS